MESIRSSVETSSDAGATFVLQLDGFNWIRRFDQLDDLASCCDNLPDTVPGPAFEFLDEAEQQGVGHRERQHVLLEADRGAGVFERTVSRNERKNFRIWLILNKTHEWKAELERKRIGDLFVARQVPPDKNDANVLPGMLLLDQCLAQVVLRNEASLHQTLADPPPHRPDPPAVRRRSRPCSSRRYTDVAVISTTLAPRTSSPACTIRPSTIASFRSGP